ncbi:MAG: DUF4386 family protein [Acidimicrobiales bacterium]
MADADKLALRPAAVAVEAAAVAATSGITALQALTEVGRLAPGQRVLVIGASGGVGSFAVQLAKALGAGRVTAVAGTASAELVRAIEGRRGHRPPARAHRRPGRSLRPRRRHRRPQPAPAPPGAGPHRHPRDRGRRGRQPRHRERAGSCVASCSRRSCGPASRPSSAREHHESMDALARHLADRSVVPAIGARWDLAQVPAALRALESGVTSGKSLVLVDDTDADPDGLSAATPRPEPKPNPPPRRSRHDRHRPPGPTRSHHGRAAHRPPVHPPTSPRRAALIAGVGYVALFVLAVFANFFVFEAMLVPGDATATAANIADAPGLFRLGVVAFLAIFVIDVVVAWALHLLFRADDHDLSLASAWLRLAYTLMLGVGVVFLAQALQLAGGSGFLAALDADAERRRPSWRWTASRWRGWSAWSPSACTWVRSGALLLRSRRGPGPWPCCSWLRASPTCSTRSPTSCSATTSGTRRPSSPWWPCPPWWPRAGSACGC